MDVYSNIMTITKDASLSEELTQEAFYRAMKSEFQGKSSELTWICAIAKNLCTDEFRKRKKEAVYDEEAIDTADNPNRTNMEQYVMSTLAIIMVTIVSIMLQQTEVYAAEQILPSGMENVHLEEKIDAYVEEHRDTTTGMATAVFDSTDELLKKYYGYVDVENQIAVTQDSVFEWGLTTKLLVWVSVMQLYKQVKIELDADICSYLPEGFLTKLSYDTPVTMLNLMNHNVGFQEGYVDLMVTDADYISSLGEALRKHEPAQIYGPGTVTAYSNWGVALAGLIVEQVRGKSFGKYVHENIFEPLQMEHSTIFMDLSDNEWVQQKRKELQCYTTEGDLIPNCFYYITLYPAGMCTSTLDDFEKFAAALLREDTTLLKQTKTWETLFSPSAYYGESGIPLNCHGFWMVPFGVKTVGHGGNTLGLWSAAVAVMQLATLLLLILVMYNVSHYALGGTYIWMFAVIVVLRLL